MIKTTFVIVVLIYGETTDVLCFDNSLKGKINDYKIIIVESFSNNENKIKNKIIANKIKADYLCVENRGYGYGNNIGIDYANKTYDYKFCIVSNADVELLKFNIDNIPQNNIVIGPTIKTLSGKNQNPYWAIECKIANKLIYIGFKYKLCVSLFFGRVINKIIREFFLLWFRDKSKRVYALHGAFLIFSKDVTHKYFPIFDSGSFLYNEEMWLASCMQKEHVTMLLNKNIEIIHKEDGCSKTSKIDFNACARNSFIRFYEKQI